VSQRIGPVAGNGRKRPNLYIHDPCSNQLGPLMKARAERFTELNLGPAYHMNKIVTHPAHRRQGLASALLDLLVKRLDQEEAAFTLLTDSEANVRRSHWGYR
jgi:GNAT superfamily N-acetyltransferase